MGHPQIDNRTPFVVEPLFVADEDGRPVVAPLVKATFDLAEDGRLELAEQQRPVDFAGTFHGEPGESSYRFEPEVAFVKPATDVALVGHAHAPRAGATRVEVELRVGPLEQRALVSGDRRWSASLMGGRMSDPAPFERIPLVWERAFGGWDRSHADPAKHAFEPRNPVGVGFHNRLASVEEGAPLPNIEDPTDRLASYSGRARPAGFGFTSPHWEPRRRLAGTYDERWDRERKPLLPRDFDRRFFNAAAPGLVADGFLRGDEAVLASHVSARGPLSFRLPGEPPPRCLLSFRHKDDERLETRLDTVILDADEHQLVLIWRVYTTLRNGPLDLVGLTVARAGDPFWGRAAVSIPQDSHA